MTRHSTSFRIARIAALSLMASSAAQAQTVDINGGNSWTG